MIIIDIGEQYIPFITCKTFYLANIWFWCYCCLSVNSI